MSSLTAPNNNSEITFNAADDDQESNQPQSGENVLVRHIAGQTQTVCAPLETHPP